VCTTPGTDPGRGPTLPSQDESKTSAVQLASDQVREIFAAYPKATQQEQNSAVKSATARILRTKEYAQALESAPEKLLQKKNWLHQRYFRHFLQ
jgi:predicted kinase